MQTKIRVFVTSIGEPTTEICLWSLERLGLKPELIQDKTTLREKLIRIYKTEDDFLRVDADVVCNKNVLRLLKTVPDDVWWVQGLTFDWFKQDITHGGVQFIKQEALPAIRDNIQRLTGERPETEMYRLAEFHNPRRCVSSKLVCGLTNYKADMNRVKKVKAARNQLHLYDWPLAERLNHVADA